MVDAVNNPFNNSLFANSAAPEYSGTSEYSGMPDDAVSREAWLRLAFVGLPAGRCHAALARWSTPEALLEAARAGRESALLETTGITPVTIERLREAATRDISKALAAMETYDIRLLLQSDAEYPTALRNIVDPPPYLFIRGSVEAQDEVAVGIVGTRHATEYGRGIAERLATDLARRGVTVVSGLPRLIKRVTARSGQPGDRGRTARSTLLVSGGLPRFTKRVTPRCSPLTG